MRRPVVKEELVHYMRTRQKQTTGFSRVRAIRKTRKHSYYSAWGRGLFQVLLQSLQPKHILEIGTAIGFSALLMAENAPDATIVTIDRNREMIDFAKANFAKYDSRQQIRLLEGDAADILFTLEGNFDFVFMDSAKSKYIVFLPEILRLLKVGGVVILDDVFQGGDITKPIEDIRRGQRTIYRGLQSLFDATLTHPNLTTSLVPLSDGLLMIRKNQADILLPD